MLLVALKIFVAAALTAVQADGGSDECSSLAVMQCAFLVDEGRVSDDLWAESGAHLDSRCENSLPALKCFHDFAVRCPHLAGLEHLGPFYRAQYGLFQRVCDKEDLLRRKYLLHAKCINDQRVRNIDICGKYPEIGNQILNKEKCKTYDDIFNCSYIELGKKCQTKSVEVFKELLGPFRQFMENLCGTIQSADAAAMADIPKFHRLF